MPVARSSPHAIHSTYAVTDLDAPVSAKKTDTSIIQQFRGSKSIRTHSYDSHIPENSGELGYFKSRAEGLSATVPVVIGALATPAG